MGWLDKVKQQTKAINAAIDGVEQFIQKMVDAKNNKINDYGKKITANFDADFKLIESTVNTILEAHKKQIELDTKFASDNPGKALPNVTNLVSKFDPKTITLSSIAKKDTYFTPSDLVLSNSEAAQIRAQINKVGTNQYQNFKNSLQGLDKSRVEQWVLDSDAALARWNKINVPESQFIQTYSPPLKQNASIWDLKIDLLFDKRNEALKRADRDVQASYLRLMDFRKELTKKQDDALSVIPKNDDLISQLGDEKTIANLKEQLYPKFQPQIQEQIQDQVSKIQEQVSQLQQNQQQIQQKFLDASASRFKEETQQQSAIDFSVIQQRNIEDKDQSVNAVRDLKSALDSTRYIALFDAANRLKPAKKVYKPVFRQYSAPSRMPKPKELDLRTRFNLMID